MPSRVGEVREVTVKSGSRAFVLILLAGCLIACSDKDKKQLVNDAKTTAADAEKTATDAQKAASDAANILKRRYKQSRQVCRRQGQRIGESSGSRGQGRCSQSRRKCQESCAGFDR